MLHFDDKAQVCANCEFFYQHYTKNVAIGKFSKINCGHCGYKSNRRKMNTAPHESCENFKSNARKLDEEKKSSLFYLSCMQKSLEDLIATLTSQENDNEES